jgi:hypothetical protein
VPCSSSGTGRQADTYGADGVVFVRYVELAAACRPEAAAVGGGGG